MVVEIKTYNGQMYVNLAEFFPANLARTRKLFRLIRSGVAPEGQAEVRAYLADKGKLAAEMLEEEQHQVNDLQEYAVKLEAQIEDLKKQRAVTQKRIRDGKDRARIMNAVKEMSPVWVREFDHICGREGQNEQDDT